MAIGRGLRANTLAVALVVLGLSPRAVASADPLEDEPRVDDDTREVEQAVEPFAIEDAFEEEAAADEQDSRLRALPGPGAIYLHPDAPPPGIRAAYGRGFTVTSDDGRFSLTVRGRLQARMTVRENPDPDDVDIEFAVRRARLVFLGHLWSRDVQYYVQLSFAPLDLEPDQNIVVRDAVITWGIHRDLSVRVGQTKVPFSRQRVISSSALQFVDRSIVNAELNLDRDIGIHLLSNDLFGLGGILGYQLSVTGGDGRNRANRGTGLLYVARLQVQPLGAFDLADSYSEADISREARPRLSMGAGFGYNQASNRTLSTHGGFYQAGGFDHYHAEADFIFKHSGFALQGEILYRQARQGSRTAIIEGEELTEFSRSGLGFMLQGGYVFPARFELAARFAQVMPTERVESVLSAFRETTVASSWYGEAHNLKVQVDYGYLFGDDFGAGQHLARLQAQVFY